MKLYHNLHRPYTFIAMCSSSIEFVKLILASYFARFSILFRKKVFLDMESALWIAIKWFLPNRLYSPDHWPLFNLSLQTFLDRFRATVLADVWVVRGHASSAHKTFVTSSAFRFLGQCFLLAVSLIVHKIRHSSLVARRFCRTASVLILGRIYAGHCNSYTFTGRLTIARWPTALRNPPKYSIQHTARIVIYCSLPQDMLLLSIFEILESRFSISRFF